MSDLLTRDKFREAVFERDKTAFEAQGWNVEYQQWPRSEDVELVFTKRKTK